MESGSDASAALKVPAQGGGEASEILTCQTRDRAVMIGAKCSDRCLAQAIEA